MNPLTEFKRMNFFTGFFTTEDDWNQGQAYHLEKRKLHLRGLHTPGILRVLRDDAGNPVESLVVTAAGGLTVHVSRGAALDPEGNLIVLAQQQQTTLPAGLSGTVYLAIRYAEAETDWEENVEDPDFSGSKRFAEFAQIDFTTTSPAMESTWVELARIELAAGATEIKDPANPGQPGVNEIDSRFRPVAGAVDAAKDAKLAAIGGRLESLHAYHLEQQQRHNRGLFKAGIMRGMLGELAVMPAGGLTVHVQPGVALDGEGREIYLNISVPLTIQSPAETRWAYIAARYEDAFAGYLSDLGKPVPGSYRTAQVAVMPAVPDNKTWIELARVTLEAGATEVRLPVDPGAPQPNELDRRCVEWAAALAVVAPKLPTALRERIAQLMRDKRRDFAAFGARFPVPSTADLRQTALNLETLARNDSLKAETLPEVMTMLAALEQDVGQEVGATYPPVVAKPEYEDYVAAVATLRNALHAGEPIDVVLNCQAAITMAARELAEVIFKAPSADAGPDQSVISANGEATVTLDASGSAAYDDQQIITYRWEKEQ
jgi:hypothetical protein